MRGGGGGGGGGRDGQSKKDAQQRCTRKPKWDDKGKSLMFGGSQGFVNKHEGGGAHAEREGWGQRAMDGSGGCGMQYAVDGTEHLYSAEIQ
ncbi:unnamed protein product [Dicrocoelium dendriticum]|nr:unnamed protein product [Dicrocoelium dendriticum]